tara:strand:+ start:146 stop:547 length:402 start_codon:yes stop_codon:yes gene_type:complete
MNREKTISSNIYIPVSLGELVDKITILQIKQEIMTGEKLKNVQKELELLISIMNEHDLEIERNLFNDLKDVNSRLWDIEDQIRLEERQNKFDETFIQLARSVYIQNDKRALIKREINTKYNSEFIEEKSYEDY